MRAAEVVANLSCASDLPMQVTLYEANPSMGRKFLIAGKSGLNITHSEPAEDFLSRYSGDDLPKDLWKKIIDQFDAEALCRWAKSLGIETFTARSGKVFPGPDQRGMKAAPLLRRWISHLKSIGVVFKTNHRWTGINQTQNLLIFDHRGERVEEHYDAVILALGGASWPQTGSTGAWAEILKQAQVSISPFQASNCGWESDWPHPLIEVAEGLPLKNLKVSAIDFCYEKKNLYSPSPRTSSDLNLPSIKGELVITRYGLEGGPIYRLGPTLRKKQHPALIIDFKPDVSHATLVSKLGNVQRNFIREAKRRWHLDPATCALLKYLPLRGPWKTSEQLAYEVKHCIIPLSGSRPIEEAISSAGGITWNAINSHLMIKKLPGFFVAGEMIDWDAPTGGYLLQACFSTGQFAGQSAVQWLTSHH